MSTTDNITNWFKSAELDYFATFLKLWLSFNAWYRQHYNEDYIKKDRDHINIIRGVYKNQNQGLQGYDASTRNSIRKRFMSLMEIEDIESKEFRKYVEKFLYLFKRKKIKGFFDGQNREEKNLEEFFINPSLADSTIKKKIRKQEYIYLVPPSIVGRKQVLKDAVIIRNDLEKLYSYIIEIIYKVRIDLIHGDLSYTKKNHVIVKYCYLILFYLIKDLVT